jgi:hypothetical protein
MRPRWTVFVLALTVSRAESLNLWKLFNAAVWVTARLQKQIVRERLYRAAIQNVERNNERVH